MIARRNLLLTGLAVAFTPSAAIAASGPQGPEGRALREQVWRIPMRISGRSEPLLLVATLFRPPGSGPFPLALISHGAPRIGAERRAAERYRYSPAARWLVGRGYAVAVPARRGYATSEGEFSEAPGPCRAPRYGEAGEASADDIEAALGYLRMQDFVAADRVVLIGQSAGGWGSLTLAARNPEGVRAVINFAGGRGSPSAGVVCAPERLASAAAALGARTRIRSLWIYTENDTYQPPDVSRRTSAAYIGAGGPAEFHLLGQFGTEGHALFAAREGVAIWAPIVAPFLRANGLP